MRPPENVSLEYKPYLAVLAFLDDSETTRVGSTLGTRLFESTSRKVTTVCRDHRRNIAKHIATLKGLDPTDDQLIETQLPRYLFNPSCLLAFGHTDLVAITLVDVFDSLLYITADIELAIEQVSLAFCPTVASIDPERQYTFLEEMDSLLSGKLRDRGTPSDRAGDLDHTTMYDPSPHPFQTQTPLVTITRFKLGGFVALGHGLLYQRALLQAMARRTAQVLADLKEAVKRGQVLASSTGEPLVTIEDIDAFRCCYLDTQGAAEIATIMRGTNYSVAMAVVAALRTLTLSDLFPDAAFDRFGASTGVTSRRRHAKNKEWADYLRGDQLREAACHVAASLYRNDPNQQRRADSVDTAMPANHAFASTYSTLCVSDEGYQVPERKVHGHVSVTVEFDVSPGHLQSLEEFLLLFGQTLDPTLPRTFGPLSSLHLFKVGRHDFSAPAEMMGSLPQRNGSQQKQGVTESLVTVLRTADFLTLSRELLDEFRERGHEYYETDLQTISTSMVLPIPKCHPPERRRNERYDMFRCDAVARPVDWKDHVPVIAVLEQVRRRLFPSRYSADPPDPAEGISRFHAVKLEESMRRLRIPRQLRRSVSYLFQNFSNCVADPHLFDNVLDLFDSFATLYSALTEHLPAQQEGSEINSALVEELAAMTHALEDAISHRIAMTRPQNEIRDMAVDFRGGLNQLVAAADVPLKCGLGLLRRRMKPTHLPRTRNRAGAVTQFTFHPRTTCKNIALETPASTPADTDAATPHPVRHFCLAYVDMNVGHIFHPSESVFHLHEAAHLIYETLEGESAVLKHYCGWVREQYGHVEGDFLAASMSQRSEELFAGMLSFLFVFGSDSDLYLKHFLGTYGTQSLSFEEDSALTRDRFLDAALLAFLTVDPVVSPDDWTGEFTEQTLGRMAKRFRRHLAAYGPLFPGYAELFPDKAALQQAEETFRRLLAATWACARGEWVRTFRIYDDYCEARFPCTAGRRVSEFARMADIVGEALDAGDAMIENRLARRAGPWSPDRRVDKDEPSTGYRDDQRIDTLTLTCALLRAYLTRTYKALNVRKRVHLPRDETTGAISFAPPRKDWNEFLLDIGYAGVWSVLPKAREKRLRWEIVVHKALWDQSTRLRARRFVQIIQDNWPDFPAVAN